MGRAARPRVNQPTGYYRTDHENYKPTASYRCRRHDYVFYPVAWTDEDTGTYYRSGYYDEIGNRYDNVVFRDGEQYTGTFHCEYCGSQVKEAWIEGAMPKCSNCGAELVENQYVVDELDDIVQPVGYSDSRTKKLVSGVAAVYVVVMLLIIIGNIYSAFNSGHDNDYYDYSYDDYSHDSDNSLVDDGIYVEEIGRFCYYYPSDDSYYDPDTGCYFWYNDEVRPYCWQYWYEDISSNYEDYGWMEYDEGDKTWYIEVSEGSWIKLPDEYYDEDLLWHISEE